jgi:hypothetical protein
VSLRVSPALRAQQGLVHVPIRRRKSEAATIVELSHRDRRTLSGVVLAEKLHAVRSRTQSELRLLAVIMVEDTETPRVARLVARHRE